MEFFNGIYSIFAFFFIVVSCVFVLTIPHKLIYLRIDRIYNGFMLLLIILLLCGIGLQFQEDFNCDERKVMFFPLYSITFLLLYKLGNYVALKKLNRYMYYITSRYISNEESKESLFVENIAQFLMVIVSFYFPYKLSFWVLKIWYGC